MQQKAFPLLLVVLLAAAWGSAVAEEMDCAGCHEGDPDPEVFALSVHSFLDCVDCHTPAEEFPHGEGVARVDCSGCHEDATTEYVQSVHGISKQNGDKDAPRCESCHGNIHQVRPHTDPESMVHPTRLAESCGTCHSDPDLAARHGIPIALPLAAYNESVHGRLTAEGENAATCSSCHGSHAIFSAADSRSKVNHLRVPETCATCHPVITEAYMESVHGKAASHGVREAPVCTDCVGELRILSPGEKCSPVYATNIPKMTCGRCHSDLRLASKYGMEEMKVESYRDSYHGLASRSGVTTVANCSSCHGVHDILPSSDPKSHVNQAKLAETCGQCHPGAGERFAIGPVHGDDVESQHAAVGWVRDLYIWLIVLTVGGMLAHNFLDLYRKVRNPQPVPPDLPPQQRQRMSRGFRIAHAMMLSSFAVLVYTGFALKYPEAWWAQPLLRWEDSLGLRGLLHRAGAVLMLASIAVHLVHLAIDRRARQCIARMRPTLDDVGEFRERLRWFLGRRATPPHCDTLGYPEKMEYIALMWGVAVMTVTGFALWFENVTLRFLPGWAGDLATVIHFYEAILATAAIVVWHFYFVIFDPAVYPMDTAWLTGRSPTSRVLEREMPASAGGSQGTPSAPRQAHPPVVALTGADAKRESAPAGR